MQPQQPAVPGARIAPPPVTGSRTHPASERSDLHEVQIGRRYAEIGVGRIRGGGDEVRIAGVKMDRLNADKHDRVELFGERLGGVHTLDRIGDVDSRQSCGRDGIERSPIYLEYIQGMLTEVGRRTGDGRQRIQAAPRTAPSRSEQVAVRYISIGIAEKLPKLAAADVVPTPIMLWPAPSRD